MKIGWIGLGIMGTPMARNLRRGGMELFVNDVSEAAVQRLTVDRTDAAAMRRVFAGRQYDAVCDDIAYCSRDV